MVRMFCFVTKVMLFSDTVKKVLPLALSFYAAKFKKNDLFLGIVCVLQYLCSMIQ